MGKWNGTRISLILVAMLLGLGGCHSKKEDTPVTKTVEEVCVEEAQTEPQAEETEAVPETEEAETEKECVPVAEPKLIEAAVYDDAQRKDAVDTQIPYYYYNTLPENEKKIYEEVYLASKNRQEAVVSTLEQEKLDQIYQLVMLDHPEIFYSDGYVCTRHLMGDKLERLTFSAKIKWGEEEIQRRQQAVDAYTQECLSHLPQGEDQFGQIKYIYDYLIEKTQYVPDASDSQNICSVFQDRKSVCQGYAEATQYLLQKLGFEVAVVTGTAEGGGHAWNLVKADGEYYYLDTTWGDVDYQSATGEKNFAENMPVNYDYFLITTQQLLKTHSPDTNKTLPVCTAVADNYYVRMGTLFMAMDEGKIADCFAQAKADGRNTLTFKAVDAEVYNSLKQYLLTQQRVFDFIEEKDAVSYYEDERMGTICFWLKR